MLIPNKYNGYINGRRLYNVDAGIGEAALISAMIGGGSAAVTGGDPLKGALLGAITGGVGSAAAPMLGSMFGAAAPGLTEAATAATPALTEATTFAANTVPTATEFLNQGVTEAGKNLYNLGLPQASTGFPQAVADTAFQVKDTALNGLGNLEQAATQNASAWPDWSGATPERTGLTANQYFGMPPSTITNGITNLGSIGTEAAQSAAIPETMSSIGAPASRISLFDDPMGYLKAHKPAAFAAGLAGLTGARQDFNPPNEKYTGPLSRFRFNPETYKPQMYAAGGIANLGGYDQQVGEDPMNMPAMAGGGIATLGGYSDGGRMLKGPGDGMSDSIPASISGKQPARLARDEFVVPADVVSHLGNGSSDAGAKQLYAMMDRIRQARTGTKKQGREIRPTKFMPA
jgi:hypothetical protein